MPRLRDHCPLTSWDRDACINPAEFNPRNVDIIFLFRGVLVTIEGGSKRVFSKEPRSYNTHNKQNDSRPKCGLHPPTLVGAASACSNKAHFVFRQRLAA